MKLKYLKNMLCVHSWLFIISTELEILFYVLLLLSFLYICRKQNILNV